MKLLYLLMLLILSGCHNYLPQNTENEATKNLYQLNNSEFPVELIEAFVPFMGPPFLAENKQQLSYELNILNNRKIPFKLTAIEVSNLESPQTVIAAYDTDYLMAHFTRHGLSKDEDPLLLKGGQFGIANIWLTFPVDTAIPKHIFHRLIFERIKEGGENTIHPMEVAVTEVPKSNDITLGLPFKSGTWLYGANSHRDSRSITDGLTSYPQRYAIDWLLLDSEGFFVKDDMTNNKNWTTYGVDLLAVADGTVVATKDGIIENSPATGKMAVKITRDTIGGNYIVLDIGNNVHAFYAHLIPGSLAVKVGDHVTKGQILGSLGNSGSSDAPHLHFHLESKSLRALGGQGLPFHFESFGQMIKYSDAEFGSLFGLSKITLPESITATRLNEMPIGNGVIKFN